MPRRLLSTTLTLVLATGLAPRAWAQAQPGDPGAPVSAAPEDARAPASDPNPAPAPEDEAPAEEEAPPEDVAPPEGAAWLEVGLDVDFGSAVQTGLEDRAAAGTLPPQLEGLFPADTPEATPARAQPRTRLGFRPLLGIAGVVPEGSARAWGGAAGARLTHQWWSLLDRSVRPVGETRFDARGFFGTARGHALQLESAAGAWFGPVALHLGGVGRLDARRIDDTVVLASALGVGPSGRIALRLGSVTPFASVAPTWLVGGSRAGLEDALWDELGVHGGVVLDRDPVDLRLSGGWRAVAAGQLWDAALGFHVGF